MTTEPKRPSDTVWKDPGDVEPRRLLLQVFVFTVCPFLEGSTLKKGLAAEHAGQSDLIKSTFNGVETHRAENADAHRLKVDVNRFSSQPGTKI